MTIMGNVDYFDRHLLQAKGDIAEQKRILGNTLMAEAEAAAAQWGPELARFFPTDAELNALPEWSWLLRLTFKLVQPFISKAEVELHPYEQRQERGRTNWFEVQNPIVRDHLAGLPMVRPTTWKGHLRFAARRAGISDPVMLRLFGESAGDEGGRAGRLHFFPTFFTVNVEKEVVTPLKRDTGTPVRGPIDIEIVPKGSEGTFCLLYVPYPRGKEGWSRQQTSEELKAVAGALRTMFLEYGFSAKKTAGWGVVEDNVQQGYLWARGQMWPPPDHQLGGGTAFREPVTDWLRLMSPDGNPLSQLHKPDGKLLSNSEFQSLADKPASLNIYKQFRMWYDAHGEEWRRRRTSITQSLQPIRSYPFDSITEMEKQLKWPAERLLGDGANV